MIHPSYAAMEAIADKQLHLGSQQSADGNLSMTLDSEYRSHDESSSSDQIGPRRLLEKNEEEGMAEDLAMQQKKRIATSPLRRKNICITPPEESTNQNRSEQLLIADEAFSLVGTDMTKLYDAECSVRDIRYNRIHKMSTYYLQPNNWLRR